MRYLILENGVEELGCLTICALRYCVGRRLSSMPSLIIEATKQNWGHLTPADKEIIRQDVAEALATRNLGMECAEKTWLNFHTWILNSTPQPVSTPQPEIDKFRANI